MAKIKVTLDWAVNYFEEMASMLEDDIINDTRPHAQYKHLIKDFRKNVTDLYNCYVKQCNDAGYIKRVKTLLTKFENE